MGNKLAPVIGTATLVVGFILAAPLGSRTAFAAGFVACAFAGWTIGRFENRHRRAHDVIDFEAERQRRR